MGKVKLFITCSLLSVFLLQGFGNIAYAEEKLDESVYEMYSDQEQEEQDTTSEENQEKENKTISNTESEIETNDVGITVWDVFKMIFATIFVIVLLYIVLRFINKRNQVYKSSQIMENLGGTALGANRSIQIVKIGKRLLIVGVGESIQLIKEIDDEEEYKNIIEEYNKKMDQQIQPSDIVTRVMDGLKKNAHVKKEQESFSAHLKQQLKTITDGRKDLMKELEKKGSKKNE